MMNDTVVISSSNVANATCSEDYCDAFVKVEHIQACLGDTLWIVGTADTASLHGPLTEDHGVDLSANITVTVPREPSDTPRIRLRALRKQLLDSGAATLDWDGIGQELRERRGDVEDR
jgi:hypothetical protein